MSHTRIHPPAPSSTASWPLALASLISLALMLPLPVMAQDNGAAHRLPQPPSSENNSPPAGETTLSESLEALAERFNEIKRNQHLLEERAYQAETGQK